MNDQRDDLERLSYRWDMNPLGEFFDGRYQTNGHDSLESCRTGAQCYQVYCRVSYFSRFVTPASE